MIYKLACVYLMCAVLISGLGWWWRPDGDSIINVALGSAIVGFSFFSLLWCGRRILDKTGLVKVAFIIVTKYVLIGALLVWAFRWPGFWPPGFLLGLAVLFPLLGGFYFLGR